MLAGRFPHPGGSLQTASCRVHPCHSSNSNRQLEECRELEDRSPPARFNGASPRSNGRPCPSMRYSQECGRPSHFRGPRLQLLQGQIQSRTRLQRDPPKGPGLQLQPSLMRRTWRLRCTRSRLPQASSSLPSR